MTDGELVHLLKELQRRFDAGPPGDELLEILKTHGEAYDELKRRGHTEIQIEWMLFDKPSA
jgi:hypothetical protein